MGSAGVGVLLARTEIQIQPVSLALAPEARRMANLEPMCFGLGRYGRRVPGVGFTAARNRDEFLVVAEW
jgi:hypothetical protein